MLRRERYLRLTELHGFEVHPIGLKLTSRSLTTTCEMDNDGGKIVHVLFYWVYKSSDN